MYSGEYVDRSCCTICSAATYATHAPPDDVPARFVTTFLGERTPVVGRVGLRVREHTRALDTRPWTELSIEPGDRRPRGEAGRPPWFHLECALGVGVSMASDMGVLGEVCEAMVVFLEKGMEFGMESGGWL